MNTPTEAHLDLVESVRYSNDRSAALQIADSEARAVAAAVTALTCTHHNDQQRAACPVCLVTTLTAELGFQVARNSRLFLQRDEAHAELAALTTERDQLRAEVKEAHVATQHWYNRTELAEAELATEREKSERYRLVTLRQDADLAAERARLRQLALDSCRAAVIVPLVWYPKVYYVNPNDLGKINKQQVDACVAAIDAAMKEGAK